jgi:hypothetical protein
VPPPLLPRLPRDYARPACGGGCQALASAELLRLPPPLLMLRLLLRLMLRLLSCRKFGNENTHVPTIIIVELPHTATTTDAQQPQTPDNNNTNDKHDEHYEGGGGGD